MKNYKRIASTFLVLVLLLTAFPTLAFAKPLEAVGYEDAYGYNRAFSLAKNTKRQLKVVPTEELNEKLTWSSSNEKIATVSKTGIVKAIGVGTAIISASCKNKDHYVEYSVNVINRRSADGLPHTKAELVSDQNAKYTYNQMVKDLKELKEKYPDLMEYFSLGQTADTREIYEVQIGNPKASRHIVIQATMHAREYINSLVAMRQIESLLANYYDGIYLSRYYCEIFDSCCVHFIPMVNPDGVTISQSGVANINNAKLKKNLENMKTKYGSNNINYYKRWKANGRGVDLNVNYPVNWDKRKNNPSHPDSQGYKGSSAGSENETKILMKRIPEIAPRAVLSYHSTGSVMYWNFFQTGSFKTTCKSLFDFAQKINKYKDAEPNIKGTYKDLGPNFGSWVCAKNNIPTLTIENGTGDCPIKIDEFKTIWAKNEFLVPATALWTLMPRKITTFKASVTKSNKVKLTWNKVSGKGYDIQYATKADFSDKKDIIIDDYNTTSATIDILATNKTYYVRIKSYRTVKGVNYFSFRSDTLTVKRK